jgi:hypothetical protein
VELKINKNMKIITRKIIAVGVGLYLAGNVASYGTTLFTDLSSGITTNGIALANGQELGQQITLANTFALTTLTNFTFQLYSTNVAFSSVSLDVQLLNNNGPTNGPGTVVFDSGSFSLSSPNQLSAGNNLENITFSNLTINLPANNFTLGLTVQGLGTGTNVAIQLYGSPTVGSDNGAYFVNNGSWQKYTNSAIGPANFGATFLGTATVPEPSVVYLGATGIAALFGAVRLRRKK